MGFFSFHYIKDMLFLWLIAWRITLVHNFAFLLLLWNKITIKCIFVTSLWMKLWNRINSLILITVIYTNKDHNEHIIYPFNSFFFGFLCLADRKTERRQWRCKSSSTHKRRRRNKEKMQSQFGFLYNFAIYKCIFFFHFVYVQLFLFALTTFIPLPFTIHYTYIFHQKSAKRKINLKKWARFKVFLFSCMCCFFFKLHNPRAT